MSQISHHDKINVLLNVSLKLSLDSVIDSVIEIFIFQMNEYVIKVLFKLSLDRSEMFGKKRFTTFHNC